MSPNKYCPVLIIYYYGQHCHALNIPKNYDKQDILVMFFIYTSITHLKNSLNGSSGRP